MSVASTGQALKDESETIRNAVILFHDYYQKQQAAQKAKIEKDRDSLPITKYEKAIVHTLRKHRVMLIAGDTGCGKSTQGKCRWLGIEGTKASFHSKFKNSQCRRCS